MSVFEVIRLPSSVADALATLVVTCPLEVGLRDAYVAVHVMLAPGASGGVAGHSSSSTVVSDRERSDQGHIARVGEPVTVA